MKNVLIVGGTSGLGLELALLYYDASCNVTVTGTRSAEDAGIKEDEHLHVVQQNLNFTPNSGLTMSTDNVLRQVGRVDLLIYTAGFYQGDEIDELREIDINNMFSVGLKAPTIYIRDILAMEESYLPGFIAITSTSQWTPRLNEPIYTSVKAGLHMLANSVSLDERIGKVLVVAPAGMNTPFWRNKKTSEEEMKNYLDPKWVAEKVIELYDEKRHYEFRFAKILRDPPRTVEQETRYSNK